MMTEKRHSLKVIKGEGDVIDSAKPRVDLGENEYYRVAGYSDDAGMPIIYFYLRRPHLVMGVKPTQIKKELIAALCPASFLEAYWPDLATASKRVDAFRESVIAIAYTRGVYNTQRTRGVGAWLDEGRLVYSLGDRLLVNGAEFGLDQLPNSRNFYEGRPRLSDRPAIPLSTKDGAEFFKLCSLFSWDRSIDGALFAGWCFLAGICGALRWRPHIYVYGPKGSGKTWIMSHVTRPAVGDIGLHVQSVTTEAGLRQMLRSDARPVLFDEAEAENESSMRRMQSVFGLARQASSESGGQILKGSAGGTSEGYQIRSMFCFSSISPAIIQSSDDSRITELGLVERHDPATFGQIVAIKERLLTEQFPSQMTARALQKIDQIYGAVAMFEPVLMQRLQSQRLADQCAPLLAGAWFLCNDTLPTREQATEIVYSAEWASEDEVIETPDWRRLLDYLLSATVRVEHATRAKEHSIDELIDAIVSRNVDIETHLAESVLRRYGLRVEGGCLVIANSHPALKKILSGTPYLIKWSRVLRTAPDAEVPSAPTWFGKGFKGRCIKIPLHCFFVGSEPTLQK